MPLSSKNTQETAFLLKNKQVNTFLLKLHLLYAFNGKKKAYNSFVSETFKLNGNISSFMRLKILFLTDDGGK
jgi:hypothetical protein